MKCKYAPPIFLVLFTLVVASVKAQTSYDIVWTEAVGVSISGNTITKTAPNGYGNSGAASANVLPANTDGWIEFTIDGFAEEKFFGFSDVNTDAGHSSIDYAISTYTPDRVAYRVNGTIISTDPANAGDVFRLERSGSTILIKRNGTLINTIADVITGALIADASINQFNGKIANARASFWIPASQGQVPDQWEFDALKAIYDNLGGPNWTNKTNWPAAGNWPASATSAQFGTWYGITVTNGDITSVSFHQNNLVGTIPAKVSLLAELTYFRLTSDAQITGSIPSSLGTLSKLTFLYLFDNQLTGSIPAELGSLQVLYDLGLNNNKLTGTIPSTLGNLPNLARLALSYNNLSGNIPSSLGNVSPLSSLSLNHNMLTGPVPESIGSLPNLRYLYLHYNELGADIPAFLTGIQSLVFFPQLNIVPDDVEYAVLRDLYSSTNGANWTNKTNWPAAGEWPASATSAQFGTWYGITVTNGDITSVSFHQNNLVGTIPAKVSLLAELTYLRLTSDAQITGSIPSSLGTLSKLTFLYLFDNQLTGSIPTELGSLQVLYDLGLNNNKLTGTIPSTLGNLPNLARLDLSYNNLSGNIPSSLGNVSLLSGLLLNHNKLTGPVPESIGSLPNLRYLYLHYNELGADVPAFLTGIQSLVFFPQLNIVPDDVEYAVLRDLYSSTDGANWTNKTNWPAAGEWPTSATSAQFGTWHGITVTNGDIDNISLHANNLVGVLPSSLGQLTRLSSLYLYSNQISGSLPSTLGSMTDLYMLSLSWNRLSGEIPSTLGNLSNLGYVGLSSNQLSGTIPASLGNCTALAVLMVDDNQLTGSIPESLCNLVNLQYLYLQSNKLSGTLPSNLGNLNKLQFVRLSTNQFTGEIPASLSKLTQLQYLALSGNQLSGALPDAFGGMANLQFLYVHSNALTGPLPPSLGNCSNLRELHSGSNNFTSVPSSLLTLPLQVCYIDNNQLSTLPDFTTHVNKANLSLRIDNNYLDFSHIEPLVGTGLQALQYAPQKTISDIQSIDLVVGSRLEIPSRSLTGNTSVVWEKLQGSTWSDVNASNQSASPQTYIRNSAVTGDAGTYRWRMSNTQVTGMTLQSGTISVKTAQQLSLDTWAFQYKYDARRRMTHKKVPGADWVYMVYDDRDRLVMTQDGEQRKSNKWSYTKYDALNRPVMTGIYTHGSYVDQSQMQAVVNDYYNSMTPAKEWFETFSTASENVHYYDNKSFPQVTDKTAYLTITYYDSYAFAAGGGDEYDYLSGEVPSVDLNGVTYSQPTSEFLRVIGQVTGTKTKALYGSTYAVSNWLTSVNYYDDRYRLVQAVSDNGTGGIDRVTNLYDFTGKVLATKTKHYGKGFLHWKDISSGIVSDGLRIYRSTGGSTDGLGAASDAMLSANADGWFEFTYSNANMAYVGFSDSNPDNNFNTIDYGVRIGGSMAYAAIQGGVSTIIGTHAIGDIIRLERQNGIVRVKRNGKIEHTFNGNDTSPLLIDASFFSGFSELCFTRSSFEGSTSSIQRSFDYDHAGRLLKTWHRVNDGTPVLLAQNEYNELGQLVTKKLHSTDPATTPDASRTFRQHEDFRYNIRGWLTRINNSDLTPEQSSEPRDLFGMNLAYNESLPELSNVPAFNGNISAIKWSNHLGLGQNVPALELSEVRERAYAFDYDPMNRLTAANHRQKNSNDAWNTTTAYREGNISYDLNGNIQHLERAGENDVLPMDNLGYTYLGNQLQTVTDSGDKTKGFSDGSVSNDYVYDANGNMIVDRNKLIDAITYNHLNLPEKVTKSNGQYIKYTYDASGRKLSQSVYNATDVLQKRTDYAGEFIHEETPETHHISSRAVIETSDFSVSTDGWEVSLNCGLQGNQDNISGQHDALKLTAFTNVNNQYNCENQVNGIEAGSRYIVKADFYIPAGNVIFDGFKITNFNGVQTFVDARSMPRGTWIRYESLPMEYTTGNRFAVRACSGSEIIFSCNNEAGYMKNFSVEKLNMSNDKIVLINHEQGRIVPETDGSYTYQYHLKDHLGNVRLTFTTKDETESAIATMETENTATERSEFIYYDEAVKVHSGIFDHTNDGEVPSMETDYAVLLRGGTSEKYGLAKSLSVMPGDVVKVEVFAKYLDRTTNGNWGADFAGLVNDITANTPGVVIDGGSVGSIGNFTFPYAGLITKDNQTAGPPKAYLNFIVFNRNDEPVDFGFLRVSEAAAENGTNVAHERLFKDNLLIREPGYVYIYLSNENETLVDVFFDDFKVEHVKSPVVQVDDYYAFGFTFNSYSRENATPQDYRYNGKEEQTELGLGWLDYGARMYQPEIGRFGQVDPLSESYTGHSPFSYATNNPIYYVDENGEFKIPHHKRITYRALARANIKRSRAFDVSIIYGNTIKADLLGAGDDHHFDGRGSFYKIVNTWKDLNAKIDKAPMGSTTYGGSETVALGVLLHNVQDFYAHSNYIELFVKYYQERNGNQMPSSMEVPTFDEVMNNPHYEELREYLKKDLKTGEFNLGRWIAGVDKKVTNGRGETHHDEIAKDQATGSNNYYFDLAFEVAVRHSANVLNSASGGEQKKKKKQTYFKGEKGHGEW